MTNRLTTFLFCFLTFAAPLLSVSIAEAKQNAIKVELRQSARGWELLRDGKPYYINGAGCNGPLGDLASKGANSTRTWNVDDQTTKFLDEAHAKGLSVAVGIWIEHERHGMDYQDFDSVTKQIDFALDSVRKHKDHPAVLTWGIGNEMEGEGSNPAIWSHLEHIANLVKKEDPNHPVMTVIAEIGGRKVEAIHKLCPSVDIIGINSYGGAPSLPKRYRELGGTKPYIVTEFGPVGTWEVPKDSIDAIHEPLSHVKAAHYKESYDVFKSDRNNCLGSYAFLWGHKQEATATWFGMLLPNGKRTASVDTMTELWSGKKPSNVCPQIRSLTVKGPHEVEKGHIAKFELDAFDPDNDSINVKWILTGESSSYVTGGDKQAAPESYEDAIVRADNKGAEIKMPASSGLYRVYAYVDDGEHNGGAVANIPIRVTGPVKTTPGAKSTLPLVVFDESDKELPYIPSGFMGSIEALKLDLQCRDNPRQGKHCIQVDFTRGDDWGGVVWQSPANDWGDLEGGFDLRGATKMTFWARGKNGGETVTFGVGVIGREKPFFDTAKKEIVVKLAKEWQQYTIDLKGSDLHRIKSGFLFSLAGQGQPLTFYLDDLKFE